MLRLKIDIPDGYGVVYGKKKLRSVMRQAGAEVAGLARSLIRKSQGGGRYYSIRRNGGLELHQASAPGQAPASLSGQLANSIRVRTFRGGDGVSIRETVFYGKFLETGARGGGPGRRSRRKSKNTPAIVGGIRVLEPRPYLSAALEQRQGSIAERIKDSVIDDLEFKKAT